MIDFADIFNDEPFEDIETRETRRAREDQRLFSGKRLHEVTAVMSMDRIGRRASDATVYRATQRGPAGRDESIGLVFDGERRDELKEGQLMAAMEADRQRLMAEGDYSTSPTREVSLIGSWTPRSWTDRDGKRHKAFDLTVAAWSFTNANGEKVMEGAVPADAAANRAEERQAAVRAVAERRAETAQGGRGANRGTEIDF